MAFPDASMGNKMSDVQKFFETSHVGHYKVYNLCAERKYDAAKFAGRLAEYPVPDKTAPPLDAIAKFCTDAGEFLERNPTNVVAVHCKNGRDLTGTFVSCLLLWNGTCSSASVALRLFGQKRGKGGIAVRIPSLERCVRYFEKLSMMRAPHETALPALDVKSVNLTNIKLTPLPKLSGGEMWVSITQRGKTVFHSKPLKVKKDINQVDISCDNTRLSQDVFVQFYHKSSKHILFACNFHVHFLKENLMLWKCDLDKACKDTQHKIFAQNFNIQMYFKEFQPQIKVKCFHCQLDIAQSSMTTHCESRTWHWECAICCKCNKHVVRNFFRYTPFTLLPRFLQGECCTFTDDHMPLCVNCASVVYSFFNFCEGCGQVIDTDAYEEFGTMMWHTQCLKCSKCAALLGENQEVHVANNKLFCEECVQKVLRSQMLAPPARDESARAPSSTSHTAAPIVVVTPTRTTSNSALTVPTAPNGVAADGEMCDLCGCLLLADQTQVLAMNKHWHKDCFSCAKCSYRFSNNKFYAWKGLPYCLICYEELRTSALPKCATCNQPIVEPSFVKAEGNSFHKACFLCAACNTVIKADYFMREGKVYCRADYDQLFAVTCKACGKPVVGGHLKALGFSWHTTCFMCCACKRLLQDCTFFEHNGEPVCEECGQKLVNST
eukprot:TRINITY_DN1726_c0_g1_i7.p1 TRINITY_DN1726_c0_g1~~TRINITY_DN1726_c0_g1_i7.p1  ORF type:complete len:712 (-),score=155.93 TRINITY_DN1726_c0_g1_i7:37-2025(-)